MPSRNFNARIDSLQSSLEVLLTHFGIEALQALNKNEPTETKTEVPEEGPEDSVMQEATF
jgi:hypothetical protein